MHGFPTVRPELCQLDIDFVPDRWCIAGRSSAPVATDTNTSSYPPMGCRLTSSCATGLSISPVRKSVTSTSTFPRLGSTTQSGRFRCPRSDGWYLNRNCTIFK
jgi:hypothetical protein